MTAFHCRLFGAPLLASGEGPPVVPTPGAKALALLAYLVLEHRPHAREALAGLLWGESPDADARASLRQTLKHLRDALGDALHAGRTLVELRAPIACDVVEFRQALQADPARAATFDVPRFLEGLSIRRAPLFEEWVAATRSALVRQYHQALGDAAREAVAQWRWRDAVELADRWLDSDPLADEAAYLAVESRYRAGHRGAALARFAEYAELLSRETGREPGRELETLARRVGADRDLRGPTPPIPDEWFMRAPSFESSLVGRDAPRQALTAVWQQVCRGEGRIVLVEGDPGVGKSRLAEELLRSVVAEGGTALRGRCYGRSESMPYEPVVEALRGALAAPGIAATDPEWLVEVARLVPEVRDRFPALPAASDEPAGEGWRLFEGAARLVASTAAERPVVILIDDLQWCQEDSCHLLRYLMRRLEHAPVLWLGLLTPGEVDRDAPALRLCRALRAKSRAEVILLGALIEADVWLMLREMGHLTAPNDGRRLAARLFRITGGNPFYLIELLKTMFAQGLLQRDEATGEWTASPDAVGAGRELPVSRTVQDVIAERVDRLPNDLRDVLMTLSVGGATRPVVLSHVHGISRLRAAALGDALVDRHLAIEEAGAYRCLHPVIAHMVRDGLGASRRLEIHRSLALALEQALRPAEAVAAAADIARHADRGGVPELAYRYAVLAARAASARFAFTEALTWLDLAATSARSPGESQTVDRLTADVLERAGLSELPTPPGPLPVTREIVSEDLDLPVRG